MNESRGRYEVSWQVSDKLTLSVSVGDREQAKRLARLFGEDGSVFDHETGEYFNCKFNNWWKLSPAGSGIVGLLRDVQRGESC